MILQVERPITQLSLSSFPMSHNTQVQSLFEPSRTSKSDVLVMCIKVAVLRCTYIKLGRTHRRHHLSRNNCNKQAKPKTCTGEAGSPAERNLEAMALVVGFPAASSRKKFYPPAKLVRRRPMRPCRRRIPRPAGARERLIDRALLRLTTSACKDSRAPFASLAVFLILLLVDLTRRACA
jgi:hypothetical protein